MEKINLNSNFIKEYLGWIVAITIAILAFNCGGSEHSTALALRDKENAKAKLKIDSLFRINKNKDLSIDNFKKKISETDIAIYDLNKKILANRIETQKKIEQIKTYGLSDWQDFYKQRTGFDDLEIKLGDNTLNMTKKPLAYIGNELVKYDLSKYELKNKNEIIDHKDFIIFQKDSIINKESEKNVNLLMVKGLDSLRVENLNKNVSDLKSDLKKANKIKLKPIIISAVLGGIAGAYLNNK